MSAAIFCSAEVFTLDSLFSDILTSAQEAEGLRRKKRRHSDTFGCVEIPVTQFRTRLSYSMDKDTKSRWGLHIQITILFISLHHI